MKAKRLNEEKGMALIISILLLLVTTLIGISAVSTANYDNHISGNKRIAERAFYVAEAGLNEFLGRFRDDAASPITDAAKTNINWRLFLAQNAAGASRVGYSSGNSDHALVQSLQNQLDFATEVRHKVVANNVVFSAGSPIYIVRGHGFTPEGGRKVVEIEMLKTPNLDPQAPLYSEHPVNIHGSSTFIKGIDTCGNPPRNKPGIAITMPYNDSGYPVDVSGNPTIIGANPDPDPDPRAYSVQYNAPNADLRGMMDLLKSSANFSYSYGSNQTLSGYSDQWGTPTTHGTEVALEYPDDAPLNIVYFNMQGNSTLKLSGGSHGAGILLVDGNLELNGGFIWYGLIIVTGALDYTGGGQKNVTGGVYAAEIPTVTVDVGGNAGILYCSRVGDRLKQLVSPFRIARWREVY